MPSIRSLSVLAALLSSVTAQEPRPLPPLTQAAAAYDCQAGAGASLEQMLDRLAAADVVFVGETHVDDTTHRLELAILEGLLARRQGKVVLAMEMFERDVQPVLDDYLAGKIDEATFLQRSRPWGNYPQDYRPLVEAARAAHAPVVAANFPAMVRRKLGMGGKQALDALSPEDRAFLPTEIFPASEGYWQRVDRAVRGHMGGGGGTPEERLYDGQNLWDNAMGDSVAKAHAAHPDHLVLHVVGGFHVAYHDGTFAQFRRRSPDAKAVVVELDPVGELRFARPERDRQRADWLVAATAVARSEVDDTFAVSAPAELRYRLHLPQHAADAPLLVWLPDRGTRVEDAFAFWRLALGDRCAIAVVEPTFPALQDDLAVGGRYVFGDGFRADYGRAVQSLAGIVEYLSRRCGTSPTRVLVGGAGDGGSVALWAALYSEWLTCDLLAVDPNDLTRLSMEGLPDLPPTMRGLRIAGHRVAKDRLDHVAEDYAKVGGKAEVVAFDGSARALVELAAATLLDTPPEKPAGDEVLLVLERDLPRARQWADLFALQLGRDGFATRLVTPDQVPADIDAQRVRRLTVGGDGAFPVASFANGDGLPLAGGPFGGTTIVVLPKGTSDADRAAWQQIEQKRAIKHRSMFANLALAGDGVASLHDVLAGMRQRGRSRALVVPAVFCADAATMRALQAELDEADLGMDLWWLPGLGGELVRN